MTNLMRNLKISTKVFGGFALILLLLATVAVLGVVSMSSVGTDFSRYREVVLQSNQAVRVQEKLLEARVAVKDYLLSNSPEDAQIVLDILDTTKLLNQELGSLLSEGSRKEASRVVSDNLTAYSEAFEEIVSLSVFDPLRGDLVSNELERIGPIVASELEDLKLDVKAEQDEIGPRAAAASKRSVLISEILAGAAIIIGIIFAWLTGRGISQPIVQITEVMKKLAAGDKEANVPGEYRGDEIGEMSQAVLVFKEGMIRADQLAEKEAEALKLREKRAEKISELTAGFDSEMTFVLKALVTAAKEMQSTATGMTNTAEETSRQAGIVATAAEQASANVQTVASATEELSASISEINQQVGQSSTVAARAVVNAEETNVRVRGLADAAQKIGDVVGLISDIAEKTNLLALNATIEAARAGDAGKGFAVVAAEVKNLATATSKATDEITAQVSNIQSETDGAVEAIAAISSTISEISEVSAAIASAVEQQGAATLEITRNVQEAAGGTSEVTSSIISVNEAAVSTGGAAEQVLDASGSLLHETDKLREKVQEFLSSVRAV
ncbi:MULTISPECIES: HAMP domain-containing methyl-accepting chemotaxis protein [unclassified Thalassospira]|uniref:methyl-accepting chemotaxis protein n=1 Tax=unclassified Thalassospira TaxID=2648997 RepID=UPI001B1211C7|nr:HAMP domain-containing methyl-accepting chemotaxis protein [Thalassospira sp.]MBO6773548.1 HAMP domain-containing protein [Thalassospira sp.]MBR9899508.1 HAMP domain-containing protein [Rhodospirillales bacterium]